MLYFHKVSISETCRQQLNLPILIKMKSKLSARTFLTAATAVILLTGFGCHHPGAGYPEEHSGIWTPSEVENVLAGDDPMENFNRPMFAATHFLMNYAADPLGRVYTTIFPRPFIEHFNNVCVNLEYPARLMSSLLQAQWQAAGTETIRFFANSTLGIAGIFDVAKAWWHIPQAEADFGQAFASWGIGPGETFMLPVVPAINGRDMLGALFDAAFDLKTYIPYAGYATFLNRMVIAHAGYEKVTGNSFDPYKDFRQMMLIRRELQLRMYFYKEIRRQIAEFRARAAAAESDPHPPLLQPNPRPLLPEWLQGNYHTLNKFLPQDDVSDAMRSAMFNAQKDNDYWYMPLSLFNSDFIRQAYRKKALLAPGREKLCYTFWKAPDTGSDTPPPEKLVILLPGIGGKCDTAILTALAEKFHHAGFAALGVDSTFSWRFLQADGKGLPGYLPDDAARLREALKIIIADLKKQELIREPEITICGYSMGGLQSLKLAEMEETFPHLPVIHRFIAINPPVSTGFALQRIDSLIAVSANWSKSEMKKRLIDTAGRIMMKLFTSYEHFDPGNDSHSPQKYQIPLDKDSAKYVVGLSLKLSMRELLLAAHMEKPLAGFPEYRWGKRNALYLAIDRITMDDYANKLLKMQYPQCSMPELLADSDLRSIEKTLRNSPNIRVFHALDDFLLNENDRRFLDSALRERITWFSNGSHLGSLYYKSVSDRIIDAAK